MPAVFGHSPLGDMLTDLVRDINELLPEGVTAVSDERDLVIPGALVGLESLELDRLGAGFTATWRVAVITRDNGPTVALAELGALVLALAAEGLPIGRDVEPQAIILPNHSADPLPAFSFTITTSE